MFAPGTYLPISSSCALFFWVPELWLSVDDLTAAAAWTPHLDGAIKTAGQQVVLQKDNKAAPSQARLQSELSLEHPAVLLTALALQQTTCSHPVLQNSPHSAITALVMVA